ncbi:GIY-YIG nuclease family protein [Pedobacter sp. SD-b]|uniref:GIY-YIG nuclease family protein n=1 Tax=Pedobacter segetis TaxID=2793069 RepID=A0ABS1BNX2_9SPHI|nr:GIY-YIG nuclease family protein [Pedobacter segetis]MBK0384026.1 GIY-YIG nuclease family protein [Pedobacter segetis]
MKNGGYTYIVTNKYKNVFYIGVTSNLVGRIYEHKNGIGSKFTTKYRCTDLVYYEWFENISHAIEREKQLKNWHRDWKINLIKQENPLMVDLYDTL